MDSVPKEKQAMAFDFSRFRKNAALGVFALGLAAFACNPAAHADDGPFHFENSQWMSFPHYKDAVKRGLIAAPAQPAAPDVAAAAQPSAPSQASAKPTIAAPRRPIDLPVMPTLNPNLNKGFILKATSTAAQSQLPPLPVLRPGKPADIHLRSDDWTSPKALTQEEQKDRKALPIRLSFLPNEAITPLPSLSHKSAQSLANDEIMKRAEEQAKPKTPAEAAACAAIDAYKKQQLEAIQSDQRTLKALQAAIAALGLQKKLGFIPGTDALSTPLPKAQPEAASEVSAAKSKGPTIR
ncbi:MAG: hypothetical protein KGI97_06160 [Alphaproteobacteria bacterium]|nr:hypothetical protein [Alphaproteobacteria bacterium]